MPDHLRQNFSRYVELEGKQEEEEFTDLSGGEAEKYAIWNRMDADTLCDLGVVIGWDPESCIRAVREHEKAGADQLMIMFQSETIPHDKVMKSIELFGQHVIPEFKGAEEKPVGVSAGA